MNIGIYLSRHSSGYTGMAIYTKALALSIARLWFKKRESFEGIILFGDQKIIDAGFLNELDRLGVNYDVDSYKPLGRNIADLHVSPVVSKRLLVCLLPYFRSHKLSMLYDLAVIPVISKRYRLSLLHSTSNYGSIFGSCPQIVTVHDLFQAYPEYGNNQDLGRHGLGWILARLFFRTVFYIQFRTIKHFITDIGKVADDIVKRYSLKKEQISLIPLGLDNEFVSHLKENDCDQRRIKSAQWCEKYNLKPGFILLFGSFDERKNFARQLISYRELGSVWQGGLVIVGNDIRLNKKVSEILGDENIQRLGVSFIPNITRSEVPLMLDAAAVVLNATLAEGFGLPAYEAAALGTRIVTGELECLSGIEANCCFVCNPVDQKSISQALVSAVEDFQKSQGGQQDKDVSFNYRTMADVANETYALYLKICATQ